MNLRPQEVRLLTHFPPLIDLHSDTKRCVVAAIATELIVIKGKYSKKLKRLKEPSTLKLKAP